MEEKTRLNVILQRYGVASRRQADRLIETGKVQVNDSVVKTLGTKVSSTDKIRVDGKLLKTKPKGGTYLFHKPIRTITSRRDNVEGRATIFDLPDTRKLPANIQAVGRLDYNTEGLLILTSDGDLALALTHPRYSVEKTYAVLVDKPLTEEQISRLRKGINLQDGFAKPASVKVMRRMVLGASVGQWVEVVVTEGRNRLVRRLFEAVEARVLRLIRVSVGKIRLPMALEPGKARKTTAKELEYLEGLKAALQKEEK